MFNKVVLEDFWVERLNFLMYLVLINAISVNNSLWPSDAIWRYKTRPTLVQVMAWCLTAPSHCPNQCWVEPHLPGVGNCLVVVAEKIFILDQWVKTVLSKRYSCFKVSVLALTVLHTIRCVILMCFFFYTLETIPFFLVIHICKL